MAGLARIVQLTLAPPSVVILLLASLAPVGSAAPTVLTPPYGGGTGNSTYGGAYGCAHSNLTHPGNFSLATGHGRFSAWGSARSCGNQSGGLGGYALSWSFAVRIPPKRGNHSVAIKLGFNITGDVGLRLGRCALNTSQYVSWCLQDAEAWIVPIPQQTVAVDLISGQQYQGRSTWPGIDLGFCNESLYTPYGGGGLCNYLNSGIGNFSGSGGYSSYSIVQSPSFVYHVSYMNGTHSYEVRIAFDVEVWGDCGTYNAHLRNCYAATMMNLGATIRSITVF